MEVVCVPITEYTDNGQFLPDPTAASDDTAFALSGTNLKACHSSLDIFKEHAVPQADKPPAINDLYGLQTTAVGIRFTDEILALSDVILLNMAKKIGIVNTGGALILDACYKSLILMQLDNKGLLNYTAVLK